MILSVSHNPKSDAKYARHRANWKGQTQQLLYAIEALRAENRTIFFSVQKGGKDFRSELEENGMEIHVSWEPHGLEHFGPKWKNWHGVPLKWNNLVDDELRGDLPRIWEDFCIVIGQRSQRDDWYGDRLGVVAISRTRLDLTFSKHGFQPFHHFYHWQAVGQEEVQQPNMNDGTPHYFLSQEDLGEDFYKGFKMH